MLYSVVSFCLYNNVRINSQQSLTEIQIGLGKRLI